MVVVGLSATLNDSMVFGLGTPAQVSQDQAYVHKRTASSILGAIGIFSLKTHPARIPALYKPIFLRWLLLICLGQRAELTLVSPNRQ